MNMTPPQSLSPLSMAATPGHSPARFNVSPSSRTCGPSHLDVDDTAAIQLDAFTRPREHIRNTPMMLTWSLGGAKVYPM